MILYSIIVAVYNVERYLEECLDSIVNQTYQNWEAILVDDGSEDHSGEICDRYAKKDSRFRVFHNENKGSLIARRYGIGQAKGDYILVIDSDDLIHKELLRYANSIIDVNKYSMFIYKMKWGINEKSKESQTIYPEGTVLDPISNEQDRNRLWMNVLQSMNLNSLCLKIFSKNCFDFEKDYDPYRNLKSGTDMIQSLAVLDKADTIYFSEKAYYYYRQNTGGISSKKGIIQNKQDICRYFDNKRMLTEIKFDYVSKNMNVSKDDYVCYFSRDISNVILALSKWNLSVQRENRTIILESILEQKYFEYYKTYIVPEKLNLVNRKIYEGMRDHNITKINFWLKLPELKLKFIDQINGMKYTK